MVSFVFFWGGFVGFLYVVYGVSLGILQDFCRVSFGCLWGFFRDLQGFCMVFSGCL